MTSFRTVALLLLCFASEASANIVNVDFGLAQNFNLFAINNFTSSANDVEGAVAVGGNMNVFNYSINALNTPGYAGDALVVNGNLNFVNGAIGLGNAYVGGTVSTSGLGFSGSFQTGAAPFSFAQTANVLYQQSAMLAGLTANGIANFNPWGGVTFTGDGTNNTQIFNVAGNDLLGINSLSLSNMLAGQSVIFNVSGSVSGFNAAGLNTQGYNVLFNFDQATQLAFNGVGVFGSVLAPYATVTGTSGQINGNVFVNNWLAGIQVNHSGIFTGATVDVTSAVPEPGTLALLFPTLGFLALRRRTAK